MGCLSSMEIFNQRRQRSQIIATSNWIWYFLYHWQIHHHLESSQTQWDQWDMDPQASRVASLSWCCKCSDKQTASGATTAPLQTSPSKELLCFGAIFLKAIARILSSSSTSCWCLSTSQVMIIFQVWITKPRYCIKKEASSTIFSSLKHGAWQWSLRWPKMA